MGVAFASCASMQCPASQTRKQASRGKLVRPFKSWLFFTISIYEEELTPALGSPDQNRATPGRSILSILVPDAIGRSYGEQLLESKCWGGKEGKQSARFLSSFSNRHFMMILKTNVKLRSCQRRWKNKFCRPDHLTPHCYPSFHILESRSSGC